ncbi:Pellicle/biofilm biosynthesis protein PslC, CAZy glycosyltransferase family 2 [Pseudomonas chlororaphis subsp. aurantiaca]|nr:Pellicle/biofilm biosynthesis protein PslC, CAZy glycosyltransferase family 2 [Pseudomonas chlororaphis subsp. aurantiaca]
MMKVALIIPARNAGAHLDRLLPALAAQTLQPDSVLVVDSSSTDDTVSRFRQFGARVEVIAAQQFNHGGTRRWASEQVDADALILLTQDAIPATPQTFANLIQELEEDPRIGLAYGRQLPHPGAGILEAQSRHFNYSPQSRSKSLADAGELGIKTCFSSDSFSVYRRSALQAVGGFPEDVIGSEDAHVAARMLLNGYLVRYAASACVQHSHSYSLMQEFRRYFDIGVFYGREPWIREAFGSAGGEGKRYVLAELRALRDAGQLQRVPEVLLRSALKLLGYRLGHAEQHLPTPLKRRLSMFSNYWT